eukprot:COSAG05_NODE_654_length_8069_cov_3.646926_10_plen_246_part_01
MKDVRKKLELAIGADLSSNPDDKTAVKALVLEILQETEQQFWSEESELEVEEEDEGGQIGGCQGQGDAPDTAGSTVADAVAVPPPVAAKPKVKVPKKRRTKEEIAEAKVRDAVTAWLCGSKYGLVARVERTVKAEEKLRLQAQKKTLQAEERARMHAAYLHQRSVQAQLAQQQRAEAQARKDEETVRKCLCDPKRGLIAQLERTHAHEQYLQLREAERRKQRLEAAEQYRFNEVRRWLCGPRDGLI